MKFPRRPIFAALVTAVVLGLTACVDPVQPDARPDPPEDDPSDDFRAGQIYSGKTLVRLA